MKPFLGIDLTRDKKNEEANGADFLTLRPSPALTQSFERSSENAQKTMEESKLPRPVRIIRGICGAASALVAAGLMGALDDVSLSQAYQNAPALFWIVGICFPVWAVLKLISIRKEKTVLSTEESAQVFSNLDGVCKAVFSELSVPPDAEEADILTFFYKAKDGSIKVVEKAMQITPYINPVFHVFSDADNLYLANLEGKYAFPLSSLTAIRTVKKRIRVFSWNKEEKLNKGVYKQYKLTSDSYGCVHCKSYHILEIHHNGELWGIWFPCYELPLFEKVTGLKAQQHSNE